MGLVWSILTDLKGRSGMLHSPPKGIHFRLNKVPGMKKYRVQLKVGSREGKTWNAVVLVSEVIGEHIVISPSRFGPVWMSSLSRWVC